MTQQHHSYNDCGVSCKVRISSKKETEEKNYPLKNDCVSMQTSLVNKKQKSSGEGQSLSNTASAKWLQNTKFSREIPEVSTALYSFPLKKI